MTLASTCELMGYSCKMIYSSGFTSAEETGWQGNKTTYEEKR